MGVSSPLPTGIAMNRRMLSVGVLLASAIVIAREAPRLQISPDEGALLSDEIYEQAGDWRAPPMFESEWRAPKPEPRTRIRFGYDSAYEEHRMRDHAVGQDRRPSLRDPQPSTLFRLEF